MANQEQLKILKEGVEVWNKWREENLNKWVNLYRAYLAEFNLAGFNLREVNFREANLRMADLKETDLTGANLSGAILTGADLAGSDLTGADLTGTILQGTNLTEAILEDTVNVRIDAGDEKEPLIETSNLSLENKALSSSISLIFDLEVFSELEIAEIISGLSAIYSDLGGDKLIIDGSEIMSFVPQLDPVLA